MPNHRKHKLDNIAAQRLINQGFNTTMFQSPAEAVAWLVAIQAQDYAGAKWSTGLRLRGSSDESVEEAVTKKEIVRTWAMRGTLHFVAAEDAHWMLALLRPRIISKNGRRYRQLELDEATLARSNEVLARALGDGNRLDRQELREILENEGVSAEGQRLFYMLQHAALEGLICQGTAPKNKPLYSMLPPPLKPDRLLDRQEALGELAARYFTSRGPATLDDFVWWSGLLVADAKAGLESAKSKLVQETIDKKSYWLPQAVLALADSTPEVILLPGFDEYLVSYRDRSAAIPDAYAEAWSKSKAMFSPSILVRGQVSGLWKRALKKESVEITADLFRDLTAVEQIALEATAQAYGRFLGKAANLQPG